MKKIRKNYEGRENENIDLFVGKEIILWKTINSLKDIF